MRVLKYDAVKMKIENVSLSSVTAKKGNEEKWKQKESIAKKRTEKYSFLSSPRDERQKKASILQHRNCA